MLKILHARLQHYGNQELLDVQAGFREEEQPEIKLPTIHWIIEKAREFQKVSTSASLTTVKPLCGSQQTGKFLQRWEYQTILPVP